MKDHYFMSLEALTLQQLMQMRDTLINTKAHTPVNCEDYGRNFHTQKIFQDYFLMLAKDGIGCYTLS